MHPIYWDMKASDLFLLLTYMMNAHTNNNLEWESGPGSVLSLLKKNGWATALVAGPAKGGSNFGIFRLALDITDEGLGTLGLS